MLLIVFVSIIEYSITTLQCGLMVYSHMSLEIP